MAAVGALSNNTIRGSVRKNVRPSRSFQNAIKSETSKTRSANRDTLEISKEAQRAGG